jgi:hypothetical protein
MVVAGAAAYAQISVGAYGGAALPMGDLSDAKFKMGFGGGVSGRYWLNDNMAAGVNFGYYSMTNDLSSDFTMSFMPITAAFDYYFMTEGFKPYAGVELGLTNTTTKLTLPFLGTMENSETPFSYGIVLGAAYGLNDKMDVFGNVKYFSVATEGGTSTFLPINVGINYKIN